MKRKIRIQTVSTFSIIVTVILTVLYAAIFTYGSNVFHTMRESTEDYMLCANAAKDLQDGSDYLTEQVRLAAMTSEKKYIDLYFQEADVTQRRENALKELQKSFDGTEAMASLQQALNCSNDLMNTEFYSMRLVLEANHVAPAEWQDELRNTQLSKEDAMLSDADKLKKAQNIVCDDEYQNARTEISSNVQDCMNELMRVTKSGQGRATQIFTDVFRKLGICVAIFSVLVLFICILIRRLIVKPLISYNESIQLGEIFPVIGAAELQSLAETYNKVYKENKETQMIIKHQAEHDPLTDLLNRGSYDRVLDLYEKGDCPFALILIDVDIFKSINDNYGHAAGDKILKRVADLLKTTFRSIDYICRIGGDEFAIIMVEMTSDLQYTIREKIDAINEQLADPEEGMPVVSLSVGVAFTDRENPGDSLFKDADTALYHTKEHGRHGCSFYGSLDEDKNSKTKE